MPANGVRTPLASLTADRENAPQVGIDWTNDPKILQIPKAIISCEASTTFPVAMDNERSNTWQHKFSIRVTLLTKRFGN